MAEKLVLATPIAVTPPSTTEYVIRSLYFGWDEQRIAIALRDNNGGTVMCTYEGAPATALMTAIAKANLSTNSLPKRIMNQLTADGKIPPGSVTGTPD